MRVGRVTGLAFLLLVSACAPRPRVPAVPVAPRGSGPPVTKDIAEKKFIATAYCHDGTTASGAETQVGMVAADPAVLPIGTRILVVGLKRGRDGTYRVMDTGQRVRGHRIDVFNVSCAEAKRFGRQSVRVAVIR
jgi:3D (Asp-Asp-Asp) domain-containing protein